MESILASSDKTLLIGELALGLKDSAPYVVSSNSATVYCHTPEVNINGTNVLGINLSSATQWADPLSHALTFQVKNLGSTDLHFVSSNPAILFRRMECRMGGCLIDDITDFNRLANLFTIYQSTGKRLQTANLGFGTVEDMFKADDTNGVSPQLFRSEVHKTKPIPAGGTKRIVMKLDLCSFLNQHHWLPCWSLSGGIDIRLTLAEPASGHTSKR